MATPNVGILTTAGKALIDKANSGQAKISFSKIVFSSMDNSQLSDMQVKALTAIAPQEVVVSSPETTLDTNSGETRIRATGTNEKLADGVYVKTYGVFAKDDTGSEILYGVTVSPNPNYFPAYDGVTPQAVTYSYKTVIQETSNITMTNSNDVYASQEDLTEALQPYIKTVDVNQQLDKKVNIADMRKPASDVAGIEEVNAKQDKIGYTPADDSKVVHTTDTSNWQKQAMFNPGDFIIDSTSSTTDFATLLRSKYNKAGIVYIREANGPSYPTEFIDAVVICEGGSYWYAYGIGPTGVFAHRQITPTNDSGWVMNADDSKVAHLSGANNFDTVPTVNNNPLLLASSLPSDLARTGSDQEFTGKNTFDTAPIDKTTGNPYITKDGVPSIPSDVARTSQQTNFTAGLQSGGVDVATAADLKSVQLKMWHEIELPDMFTGSPILMKYNPDDKTTMILGAKNATLDNGASWTGTLFTLPEGFHWIKTDSKMMPLQNMNNYNDNVSGRLYNTKLSRNGSSSNGSEFGIWFTSLSSSIISIDNPYTVVNSIQPD
ncbi:MAG: hypothetical protein L0K88_05925 [Lactiplantibacillus plantarum]|nr:hypothetical protein [Lactiplantibacillus plantarum]MDN6763835.1 hypothetical protein [Lactiplantibacillus plantarum]MDN6789688.1 hypothetical protein [Lactiplantibacillus plantarum]MDN6825182.1 hypothetical protein [Lactiplantibacillus plantarum]